MTRPIQRLTITAVLTAALLGGVGAPRTFAQGNRPPAGDARAQFASVDLQKVFNEYKLRQTRSGEIQTLGQGLDRVLQQLSTVPLLSDAELKELAGLYEKPAPADAEKTRITALTTKAQTLSDEFGRLQNVAAPNDQQKARLSELTEARRRGGELMNTLQQEYQQRLSERQAQLSQEIQQNMRTAIAKVAADKGLAVVFDSAVAVYTANDITSDVVKQLNR